MTTVHDRAFRHPVAALQPAHPAGRARHGRAGKVRRGARAGDRRGRPRRAGGAIPGGGRRGHAHALRRRRRRPHQPAAPDPVRDGGCRHAQGGRRRDAARGDQSGSPHRARRGAGRRGRARAARRARRRRARLLRQLRDASRGQRAHACSARKPLVSGAAVRFDGQVAVFDARDASAPCYHCLFGEGDELEETRCATMGVFAPLVGIVGVDAGGRSAQAPRRRRRDAARDACCSSTRSTCASASCAVPRDPSCPVCARRVTMKALALLAWLVMRRRLRGTVPARSRCLPKEWTRDPQGDRRPAAPR